jgi:uncharacterized protein YdhG (YjbR/CyaY superfamily)
VVAAPRPTFSSVDEYIASQPADVQPVLERVRAAIRKAIPKADEVISYQIPAYTLGGRNVVFFAGFKNHYSLYPANARVVAAFRKELEPYETNGKGTVRFPLTAPVPVRLISAIARFRAKEVAGQPATTRRR